MPTKPDIEQIVANHFDRMKELALARIRKANVKYGDKWLTLSTDQLKREAGDELLDFLVYNALNTYREYGE